MKEIVTLEDIYASIPNANCQGKCQQPCGLIPTTSAEVAHLGGIDKIKPTEHPTYGSHTCASLNFEGKCSIYEKRPLVCRLYGVVKALPCPFGCEPDRWLSRSEERALIIGVSKLPTAPFFLSG